MIAVVCRVITPYILDVQAVDPRHVTLPNEAFDFSYDGIIICILEIIFLGIAYRPSLLIQVLVPDKNMSHGVSWMKDKWLTHILA